jgi:transglutaminase-like putative cysteine protease
MRPSTRLTVAAGCASALATAPIGALFEGVSWIFPAVAGIAVVTCCHVLARTMRLPAALIPVAGALGLLLFLCFAYAHDGNFLGIIPTEHSLEMLRDGLRGGRDDIRTYAAPAPSTQGLLLVVTLTAGLTSVVIDTLAVSARRPAVAGLVMLALYAVPTAISAAAVPWVYFVASAGGYLVLLLAEERERMLRWGRPVSATDPSWHGDPAPIRFSGRRAGVGALAVAVLLPLVIPGISASGLANFGNNGGNGPGTGAGGIDPFATLKGSLTRGGPPIEMLQLSSTYKDLHYVRTQVLDQYTGHGWGQSQPSGSGPAAGQLPTGDYGSSVGYDASIRIVNYADKYLPLPTGADRITGLPEGENWQYDDQRSMVFSTNSQSTGKSYQVHAAQPDPSPDTLRQAQQVPDSDPAMRDDGGVPRDFPAVVRQKVEELTRNAKTPYDRVKAIRDYFSVDNGFTYSTSTVAGDTGNDLADFVLEKKQGYCQQYAAAMAIMLRVAHVPARVVLGFTRHGAVKDGHYSVMNTDAHAWVEAYFPSIGWIPWDPTPPDLTTPGRITGFGSWDPRADATTTIPTPSGGAQPSDVPSSGNPAANKESQDNTDPFAGQRQAAWLTPTKVLVLIGILLALLILASPALVRLRQRRRRLALAAHAVEDAEAAARAAWDELLATAADLDVPLRADETPRAVARRVATELSLSGEPSAGLRLVALAEERARYAQVAQVDGDLPGAVRAVRTGLMESRRRRRRVRAVMLPPSVLRAARTSLLRRNDRVSSQLDRMNSDLRRMVRRRTRPRS